MTEIIDVAVYNGKYSGINCPKGVLNAIDYANNKKIIPNVKFNKKTIQEVNSKTLSDIDVLHMPGGDGGWYYLNYSKIDNEAIKAHVADGGGYLGICAGAYSACSYVDTMYKGLGIAPNIRSIPIIHSGITPIKYTSHEGEKIGYSGIQNVIHYSGPIMYRPNKSKGLVFAIFNDNEIGYKNYGAIMADYYKKGKVILCSPHPELFPVDYSLIAKLLWWVRRR